MRRQAIYPLYERAVQTPEVHADFFGQVYRELNDGLEATSLREDFCGTFVASTAWVRSAPERTAISLDLDPEPLKYGRDTHLRSLSPEQRKRLKPLQQNVLTVTKPRVHVVAACNFSFNIFRDWDTLVRYFRCCLASLQDDGVLVLEAAGGPGMIQEMKEKRRIRLDDGKRFTYVWDQRSFDPITHEGHYAIHFEVDGGPSFQNAFTYHWRLWSLPELRKAMEEAGFGRTHTYWEERDEDENLTDIYSLTTRGENDVAWVAYAVGHKTKALKRARSLRSRRARP